MATVKSGARFTSAVSDVQVMAIKAPAGEVELTCGGVPMLAAGETAPEGVQLDGGDAGEALIGKRYVDAEEQYELLCTKGGKGTLVLNGTPLEIKQAKQLPSSD